MMGVAGDGVKADYVDSLDLFHTMEAYFTWYPREARGSVSKYLLDKFLYTVDRDPVLVEQYREDPPGHRGVVGGGAGQRAPQLPGAEKRPGSSSLTSSARPWPATTT